ncbi:fungal hydrophobin [Dendrothele bispora CBS 962.96]|uniref:Hydrophobin n=1 Tax=Dendrothele bispora (strain CBS 962.96) TaxID=1314807 RepID=A0A4S8LQ63_DENBC|nr:fungal hydrophobin [Dendrothele bispora CBS 962.96]
MQFTLLASLATLATLAVATPTRRGGEPASQCNTAPVQCCDSVQSADSPAASSLLALLGIVVQDVTIPVGITCSPISVIGVGGDSCSANPVCCEDNSFKGVVALGCVPVDLSL